jgi:hypothetical protein
VNVLDELVLPFQGEPGDWEDVLRRARRRRPRRRLVLAAAGVVAALAAASAVAVPLLVSTPEPRLPSVADASRVMAVIEPRTGRVLLQVAPWKGHRGICYVVVRRAAGCVPRVHRGIVFLGKRYRGNRYAVWTYTFDRSIVGAVVMYTDGTRRALPVHHFGKPYSHVTFFGPSESTGKKVARVVLVHRR